MWFSWTELLRRLVHPSTTVATEPVRFRGEFVENYPTILQRTDRASRQFSYIHHSSPSRLVETTSGFVEDPSTHDYFAMGLGEKNGVASKNQKSKGDLGCFVVIDFDPYHCCYDHPTKEYVAIKRLKRTYVPEHQDGIIKEIQCLSTLGDAMHVIPLKEALIDEQNNVYIATQYCMKGSLLEQIKYLPIPINHPQDFMQRLEADAKITYQKMLEAVEYIHRKGKRDRNGNVSGGIAHCNIQPDHFLRDENDSLLLTNFAMSQEIPHDSNGVITINGLWPHTSDGNKYILPEMGIFKGTFSPVQADVWACTVILFNILTGGEELYLFPWHEDKRFRFFLAGGALWWNADQAKYYFQKEKFPDQEVISIYNNHVRFFSPELKVLFKNVFNLQPERRWGMRQILESDWMQGVQQGGNDGQPLPPIRGIDQQEQDSEDVDDVDMVNILQETEKDTPSPEPLGDQGAAPQSTNTIKADAVVEHVVDEASSPQPTRKIEDGINRPVVSPIAYNNHSAQSSEQEAAGSFPCAADGCFNRKMRSYPYCEEHNCKSKGCTNQRIDNSNFCKTHKCEKDRCTNQRSETSKFCTMHKCVTERCKGNRRYANKYCSECHLKRHVVYGTQIEGADVRTIPEGYARDAIQGGNKSEGGDVPDFSRGDIPNNHEGNQRLVEMGRDLAERNPLEEPVIVETKEQEKQRKKREITTNSALTEKLLRDYRNDRDDRNEGRRFIFCLEPFKTDLKGDGETEHSGWYECIDENESNYAPRQRCGQLIRDARNPNKFKAWKVNGRLEEQGKGKRKVVPVDLENQLEELARNLIQDNPNADDAALAAELQVQYLRKGGRFLRLRGAQREWVDCSDDLALVRCQIVIRRVRGYQDIRPI